MFRSSPVKLPIFAVESLADVSKEREIPEEVAARTDQENEFPSDMWRKFGEAG